MNLLQARLKSLWVAGRKSTEDFELLDGQTALTSGQQVWSGHRFSDHLRHRLVIAPQGFFDRPVVSFVSSRLPKNLSLIPEWFQYLRAGLFGAINDAIQVINVPKTTCDPFLKWAKKSLWLSVSTVHHCSELSFDDWIQESRFGGDTLDLQVSPPISKTGSSQPLNRDELLMVLASRIMVLKSDSGSGTEKRVLGLLKTNANSTVSETRQKIFIASTPELVARKNHDLWKAHGAVGWHLSTPAKHKPENASSKIRDLDPIEALNSFADSSSYLFHCTRAPNGPWPDQDTDHYLEELILGNPAPRTPVNSLKRILQQKRILALEKLNRACSKVVSFTESSLEQIRDLRVFRPHLSRWDFEPFGIGICRQVLIKLFDAEAVIYGEGSLYDSLDRDQKPFFQLKSTTTPSGKTIDWTIEREWRVLGDVDLSRVGTDDCLVFVPTYEDAIQIRDVCNFKIVVLDSSSL